MYWCGNGGCGSGYYYYVERSNDWTEDGAQNRHEARENDDGGHKSQQIAKKGQRDMAIGPGAESRASSEGAWGVEGGRGPRVRRDSGKVSGAASTRGVAGRQAQGTQCSARVHGAQHVLEPLLHRPAHVGV